MCAGDGAGKGGPAKDYGFPMQPYAQQREFMDRVYEVLSKGGIGILESPTGTGKTLALLCPAIAWLRANERRLLEEVKPSSTGDGADDELDAWALEYRAVLARQVAEHTWRLRRRLHDTRRQRARTAMALTDDGLVQRTAKVRRSSPPELAPASDLDFSIEAPPELPQPDALPPPLDLGAQALEDVAGAGGDGDLRDAFESKLQIIFCSRTHSQLAQVLGEIGRLSQDLDIENLVVVTLGARSNLCVNDAVRARARGSAPQLNELCRLATAKDSKDPGCCKLKKEASNITDACSAAKLDIEALVQRGRFPVGGGCPYYGSRNAAREADILLVPYASLVNADMRRKLGIRTEGSILIFDEAHNLLDAVGDSNSVTVTMAQARSAVEDLAAYALKYEARLSPANALRLKQLRQFCTRLHEHIGTTQKSRAYSVGAFLVELGVDHFDLPELSHFLEKTELPRKVRGYAESLRVQSQANVSTASSSSVYGVAEFLASLQNSTADDRILSQMPGTGGDLAGNAASVRYLSLDAEVRFRDLLDSAHAVIFTGGTLEPRAEFAPLYAGQAQEPRITNFSGRHIVPSSHVLVRYVTHGPTGHALDFRRDNRDRPEQRAELNAILTSCAECTPGGCVFFFPSFEYLASMAPPEGSRLGGREVIVEKRGHGGSANPQALQLFQLAVQRDGGAVLLAVCGGKLSEGINFSDRLCRLVAVVGLPYPNASDLGLTEKMRFLDGRRARGAKGLSGKEFYTAKCMKGVNQCIGRSVRHAQDWAAMLLLDQRYAQPAIGASISAWLREEAVARPFATVDTDLQRFFAVHIERSLAACEANAELGSKGDLCTASAAGA